MSRPYSFEDSLRVHDLAVMQWLDGLHVDYPPLAGKCLRNVPILKVYSTPDRSFAEVADLLVKNNFLKPSELANNDFKTFLRVVPLPICSVYRTMEGFDSNDSLMVPYFYKKRFYDVLTGRWIIFQHPKIGRLSYTVDFICKQDFTEIFIKDWIQSRFGRVGGGWNEAFISVMHAKPWGKKLQCLTNEGLIDNSILEGDDMPYKRFTLNLALKFIFFYKEIQSSPGMTEQALVTEGASPVDSSPLSMIDGKSVNQPDPAQVSPLTAISEDFTNQQVPVGPDQDPAINSSGNAFDYDLTAPEEYQTEDKKVYKIRSDHRIVFNSRSDYGRQQLAHLPTCTLNVLKLAVIEMYAFSESLILSVESLLGETWARQIETNKGLFVVAMGLINGTTFSLAARTALANAKGDLANINARLYSILDTQVLSKNVDHWSFEDLTQSSFFICVEVPAGATGYVEMKENHSNRVFYHESLSDRTSSMGTLCVGASIIITVNGFIPVSVKALKVDCSYAGSDL